MDMSHIAVHCGYVFTPTWGGSQLVSAQLPTAVGAACVHTPIMQQEEGVVVSAGHLPQSAAGEDAAGSRLGDRVFALAEAQLPVRCAAPAPQHRRAAPPHTTRGRRLGSHPHGTLQGPGERVGREFDRIHFRFAPSDQVCQIFWHKTAVVRHPGGNLHIAQVCSPTVTVSTK